jgi:RNA polymerase sigma-B factor
MTSTISQLDHRVPTAETDISDLVGRWQRHGDTLAREAAVERFLPLARRLARRYTRSAVPMEDLVQVASLGLLKAIEGFDPDKGQAFPSYAIPTILGELRRYFRDHGWATHVPRGAQERALSVRDARDHLTNATGSAPTVNQLAEFMEISTEDVMEGLIALNAYDASSLDTPVNEESDSLPHSDSIGRVEEGFALAESRAMLEPALRNLSSRERQILEMRFAEDLTQSEIADRLGVSQMQISRVLRRTLDGLRSSIEPAEALTASAG